MQSGLVDHLMGAMTPNGTPILFLLGLIELFECPLPCKSGKTMDTPRKLIHQILQGDRVLSKRGKQYLPEPHACRNACPRPTAGVFARVFRVSLSNLERAEARSQCEYRGATKKDRTLLSEGQSYLVRLSGTWLSLHSISTD